MASPHDMHIVREAHRKPDCGRCPALAHGVDDVKDGERALVTRFRAIAASQVSGALRTPFPDRYGGRAFSARSRPTADARPEER